MGTSGRSIEAGPWLLSLCVALGAMFAPGCGGRTNTDPAGAGVGGASSGSGGTVATGGSAGAGCTGSFETVQGVSGHDLCVANLVSIPGPSGSSDYQIDATEVTRGQYTDWVATSPTLPASTDATCGWKSSDSYAPAPSCMESSDVCQGQDCDHHPVVCVDWCDATYYCRAVGKRLCGKIGGGSVDDEYLSVDPDTSLSQWYRACSSGGVNVFPYGTSFEPASCNIYGCWGNAAEESLPVATLSTCQSSVPGYSGVYDMSGNVFEWVDSCAPWGRACRTRGGAFDSWSTSGYAGCLTDVLACGGGWSDTLDVTRSDLGFRCCSL